MSKNVFPHHTGGVVQVHHVTRYGSVPEPMLEDPRLSLDSRAVAAWLAIKPAGWQISVTNLRSRLAPDGKKMLGKDLWQRIALELQTAGYLDRRKIKGDGGQWVWHVTFNPVPSSFAMAGLAGYGAAVDGSAGGGLPGGGTAADGSAVGGVARAGQSGYIEIPDVTIPIKKSTTTTTGLKVTSANQLGAGTAETTDSLEKLYFPRVSDKETSQLGKLIMLCAIDRRQDVLDEVEGIRQAGGIKRGVIALASKLIEKVAMDQFVLSAGHKVRDERAACRRHEIALKSVAMPIQNILPMSEDVLAALPPNLRRRAIASLAREDSSKESRER